MNPLYAPEPPRLRVLGPRNVQPPGHYVALLVPSRNRLPHRIRRDVERRCDIRLCALAVLDDLDDLRQQRRFRFGRTNILEQRRPFALVRLLVNWEAWIRAGASMSDVEISGGPSGIRTQDRRIKSQWLQPQNSPKTASKNRETAGKQQESGRSQATFQIQNGNNGNT